MRGRGLGRAAVGSLRPEFGLYLQGKAPRVVDWPHRWVRWPDWRLPVDRADARDAMLETWWRAEFERVEVCRSGGLGRTGTALACLAVLDGVPARDALTYVRRHYHPRAVETPWQRRYVGRFES